MSGTRDEKDNKMLVPVIAGLGSGIVLLLLMASLADVLPTTKVDDVSETTFVVMSVLDLKQSYNVEEPISFTLVTEGVSRTICNHPKPLVQIVSSDKGESVWYTPPSFQTLMLCNPQPFHSEWRFGYEGEELPFQSALANDKYYENVIVMEVPGDYILVTEFDDHRLEKEFTVR